MEYGLLGKKLGHSFSPEIHGYFGGYAYGLFEKSEEELGTFLTDGAWKGLNVTIPYKKTVIPYCDELSERACVIGSVNTMYRRNGRIYGDNTDYDGFLYMVSRLGVSVSGKKALILGNGGAALTVRAVLRNLGAAKLVVISRTGEDNYDNIQRHYDADIIVNTTPVGMYPDNGNAVISLKNFTNCTAVLDLIYNPLKTALILEAEELRINCAGGLSMLVAQAKRACELFQDTRIDAARTEEVIKKLRDRVQNIALIGMPGCGKTTVGRELAKRLAKTFVDIDEVIAMRAGKSIPQIFADSGEAAFRKMETEVLRKFSKEKGQVIATGGGIVTTPDNRALLRQNSTVIYIDRSIDELPTDGRPVSQSRSLHRIYDERVHAYRTWSDFTVKNAEVSACVEKITEVLL